MTAQDKLKILFPNPSDVFKIFHIDFNTGYIYKKEFWDRDIPKRIGRPTTDKLYTRVSVKCKNLTHIFKRGVIDVFAHRLIYYAYTGELPEKVDHIKKDVKYLDAISNLRASDAVHNRWNTSKVKRKRINEEERVNKYPSSFRDRTLEEFRGIYYAYKYYWVRINGKIVNNNGFLTPLLAVNFRNKFLKKEYIKMYGSLDNFPENAIDLIDNNELFLDQMTQEAVEKTEEYKLKQIEIKLEMEKRSKKISKKLNDKNIIEETEEDAFAHIGKYD